MTGCPHVQGQDVEVTIVSAKHSGQYLIRNGDRRIVEKIASPWSDPRVTTKSLPLPDKKIAIEDRGQFGPGWILRDGDELIRLQTSKITEGMAKVCEAMPCGVSLVVPRLMQRELQ